MMPNRERRLASQFFSISFLSRIYPQEHILCENVSVTNIFARLHDKKNVMLKTRSHTRQK